MKILSSAFKNEAQIPSHYTCDGQDLSPPLEFIDIPPQTQSLALIMEDPDVPKNLRPDGLWVHWLIWNIPPGVTGIGEGEIPPGIIGLNTKGTPGYQGPCPPDREHRYFFRLFALDGSLVLDPVTATRANFLQALDGHIIEKAELMGRYNRSPNQ